MNQFKTFILLTALTLLLILLGKAVGGTQGMIVAFIFAVGMNFFSYWYSDKIVLAMYGAKEVTEQDSPELHRIVNNLVAKMQLEKKPKVYILPTQAANAFATGRSPHHAAVAVTTGIMNILNRAELEGVLAHELAHIKNRDTLIACIAACVAGAIMMLSYFARFAAIFAGRSDRDRDGGSGLALLAIAIIAPIAAMIIQLAISRSREYLADEVGGIGCGNPLSLANALKKLHNQVRYAPLQASPTTSHLFIVNPLQAGQLLTTLFSTHPPIEERVKRLTNLALGR